MADGIGLLPIMQVGGWKSMNVIGRYVEHVEIGLLERMRPQIRPAISLGANIK
jgi:hypothetical protein